MNTKLLLLFCLSFLGGFLKSQTTLFEEDWGTTFTTVATSTKWPCKSSGASSYNSSGGCGGTGDYNYYLYGYNYIESQAITLGGSCNKLNFTYQYNYNLGLPQVQIFTGSCGSSAIASYNLPQANSCTSHTLDLDAFAGQTIYIRFVNNWSNKYFYFDDISVTTGGSGCSGGGSGGGACTEVFRDDFTSSIINSTNWPIKSGAFTTSSTSCDGGDYAAYLSADYSNYAQTSSIDLTSATSAELSYNYYMSSLAYNFQCADLEISTNGGISFTDITPSYADPDGTCKSITVDLSAYVGNNIILKLSAATTSYSFYWDEFVVCATIGGVANDYRWADDFNDNDLNLDYVGVTGDESFSGASWTLGGGASLSSDKSSFTVNYNQTEAFTASDASSYAVRLPETGYIESPSMDLSGMEILKVNFFLNKQAPGVPSTDYNLTDVYLEFWNGSSWDRIVTYDPSISYSDNVDNKDMIESGFGYHCFTAYKSTSSPGNFYYNDALHVNSSYFHSGFKFRIMFGTFNSSFREPYVYLDNISFRADADGQTCIPCGLSFWYETGETRYGHDPDATSSNHAARGYEVEIDNAYYSAAFDGPSTRAEPNDGNVGVDNALYSVEWAVISEQKITNTTYTSVDYMNNDITNVRNDDMSWDDNYNGPGYLYYRREFFGCNGESGTYDPGTGMQYNFRFDYGLNFVPVYYHLNSSGIEMHGGATSVSEQFDSDIVCQNAILPVELISFRGVNYNEINELVWEVGSEKHNDYFLMEYSTDGLNYQVIDQIQGLGTTNKRTTYSIQHLHDGSAVHYYRLSQFDLDGTSEVLGVVVLESTNEVEIFPNPFKDQLSFDLPVATKVKVLNVNGAIMLEREIHPKEQINTSYWSEGVYFVWIGNQTFKLMKY